AFGVAHANGTELVEVPRERRLRDRDPRLGEQLGELGLRPYDVAGQHLDDVLLASGLRRRMRGAHHAHPCSNNQVSKAFWTCRRFSASSQTTLCGPSMTSAAISWPRYAGRQCSTIASGAAC